jgi:hypothetical protein
VHFPGDVALGSIVGSMCAQVTVRGLDGLRA